IETDVEEGGRRSAGPMTGDRKKEHTCHTRKGRGDLGEVRGGESIVQSPATESMTRGESCGHTVELGMMSSFFMPKERTEVKGTVSEGQAKGYAFITEKQIT